MIKAIFFDMGGVLLPLHMDRCIEAYREIAGFKDIDKYLDPCHQHGFYLDIEAGTMDLESFFTECLKHCAPGTTRETVLRCQKAFFGTPRPEDVALVKELAGRYDIYMLSNNNPLSCACFTKMMEDAGLPFDKYFKKCFFSFQLHQLKPFPEIYRTTIDGIGLPPEEILFIDDAPANIAAAENAGIRTILYKQGMDIRKAFAEKL